MSASTSRFSEISCSEAKEICDHWIAFILLIYLGINMLREADAADSCNLKQHYNIREMLTLAVATSIDALAVGVSFAFLDVDIWTAAGLIGLVKK